MPSHQFIAFLRGINLGKRRVKMERLGKLFEGIGFSNVRTFIASGNVLFSSEGSAEKTLVATIEGALLEGLGYEVDTVVRSQSQLAKIAAMRPFGDDEGKSVQVTFLAKPMTQRVARELESCSTDTDQFLVHKREIYWRCRVGVSESKIWKTQEVKALKLPSGTMRNMTTVRKLAAMAIDKEV